MTLTGSPSHQDIYDVGLAALQSRRPSLVVRPGDVTDSYLEGGASMADAVIAAGAHNFRAVLLDGAEGSELHVVSLDRGVAWDQGDPAVGSVTFTRPTSALGAGTVPAGTRVASLQNPDGSFATFTTDVDVVFGALDLGPHTVTCTCTVNGTVGNVDVALVDRILDLSTLWDRSLLMTNAERFAGGSEPESDPDLRDRVRNFPLVLRRGTRDALEYGAKTTPGVKRATVYVDPSTGIITLYVADADGNANAALAAAAQLVIDGPPAWRSAADVVNCVGATLFTQNVVVSLTVRTGVDVNALVARVSAAIAARMQRLQPGETLYRDMISTAAVNVDATSIVSCDVVTPAANLVPTSSQIIRAGTVTVS